MSNNKYLSKMNQKEDSKKRKYVLFKKEDGKPDSMKPCAFFSTSEGCKNGNNCKFLHQIIKNEDAQAARCPPSVEVKPVIKPVIDGTVTPTSSKKKRKTDVRESNNEENVNSRGKTEIDLLREQLLLQQKLFEDQLNSFKLSIGKETVNAPSVTGVSVKREPLINEKNTAQRNKVEVSPKISEINTVVNINAEEDSDYSTDDEFLFNVVNHALDGGREDVTKNVITNSPAPNMNVGSRSKSVMPSQSPKGCVGGGSQPLEVKPQADFTAEFVKSVPTVDFNKVEYSSLDWQKLVTRTRAHKKYKSDYTFQPDASWVSSRKDGSWSSSLNLPKVVAIDCEMCETADPVTGVRDPSALVRFSVINGMNPKEVLLDTLVSPLYPVVDMRTRIHGIKEKQLEGVKFTLRHAQAALLNLISDQTIVIGHSVYNDLKALHFNHELCIDTAYLFSVQNENESSLPGLKLVAEQLLNMDLPETHDPIEDARISLYAAIYACLTQPGIQQQVSRKANTDNFSLLVHRIPRNCSEDHIRTMFISFSHVAPVKVSNIVRADVNSSTDPVGKALVTFSSLKHAELAFDTIDGAVRLDKRNTPQKRIYLQGGGYVCVRKYKV